MPKKLFENCSALFCWVFFTTRHASESFHLPLFFFKKLSDRLFFIGRKQDTGASGFIHTLKSNADIQTATNFSLQTKSDF